MLCSHFPGMDAGSCSTSEKPPGCSGAGVGLAGSCPRAAVRFTLAGLMAVEGISCGSELPSLTADDMGVFPRASLPAVPIFREVSSCVFCPLPNWNICFTVESPELFLCSGTNPSLGYVLANIFIRSAGSLAEHKLGELARLPRCRPIYEHAVSLLGLLISFISIL